MYWQYPDLRGAGLQYTNLLCAALEIALQLAPGLADQGPTTVVFEKVVVDAAAQTHFSLAWSLCT